MRTVPAGEFKQKCLALLDEVEQSGEPIVVTKRGRPVAQVVPAPGDREAAFGSMRGRAKILGDIVAPVVDLDALRD